MMFEQTLTQLALPCGLIWLCVATSAVAAWRSGRRKLAGGLMLLFAFYTLAGNGWVGTALNYFLEREYRHLSTDTSSSYDAVVILGGGSGEAPNGQVQLDDEGDRVMLGARMYHRGQTLFIVCSGANIDRKPGDPRDAAETAALLLSDVGVPQERIIRIGGRFTKEEMAELKRLVSERQWQRVGLITSAWHMRRAMRLAKNAGLDVHPLTANFRGLLSARHANPVDLIPNSAAMRDVEIAIRELLAGLVGRQTQDKVENGLSPNATRI